MQGRTEAVAGGEAAARAERLRSAARSFPSAVVALWIVWTSALVAAVGLGIVAGAYDRAKAWPHTPLFPFFSWDFGWYEDIAYHGYSAIADRRYAFFPLWPWLL
ncbi:MAG: hypothetical protein WBB76_10390, partial [Gaiellaceae bacterium]